MKYFDYETAAQKAVIAAEKLAEWRALFERQYHGDQMMVELRLLRACTAAARDPKSRQAVIEALDAERLAEGKPRGRIGS